MPTGIYKHKAKHGMYGTKIYITWAGMKRRCLNKNDQAYKYYGLCGITVCKEWLVFENFYNDMGDRPEGMTLDRIKNNLGYYKNNCRWATRKEQMNNTRKNVFLTYKSKTQTISQWADDLGIKYSTLCNRLHRGWKIKRALN